MPAGADDGWTRLAFVAALGLPLTLALSLLGEARDWGDAGSIPPSGRGASAMPRVEAAAGARRGVLSLNQLTGTRAGDSVLVTYWRGWVLLGRR